MSRPINTVVGVRVVRVVGVGGWGAMCRECGPHLAGIVTPPP